MHQTYSYLSTLSAHLDPVVNVKRFIYSILLQTSQIQIINHYGTLWEIELNIELVSVIHYGHFI
jgi:hypothetical protein